MKVAVFAYRNAPKHAIYAVLDKLHGESGLHVIGWLGNTGGDAAIDWAKSRPGAEVNVVSNVRASDTRYMGQYFDKRAALISIFKLFQPERALVFCSAYWIAAGVGRTICQQAEKWSVPVYLYEPVRNDTDREGRGEKWAELPEARIIELCGKKSPIKQSVCSRFKGHPSAWHWNTVKGERRSKFWLP